MLNKRKSVTFYMNRNGLTPAICIILAYDADERICLLLACISGMAACTNTKEKTVFSLVTDTNISFTNTLTESESFNVFKYRNFY